MVARSFVAFDNDQEDTAVVVVVQASIGTATADSSIIDLRSIAVVKENLIIVPSWISSNVALLSECCNPSSYPSCLMSMHVRGGLTV